MKTSLKFNEADCQFEKFGDDLVLLNFKTGSYINVTNPGTWVVELLMDGVAPTRILEHIEIAEPHLKNVTETFIADLVSNEVLVVSETSPNQTPLTLNLNEEPGLQIFSDLADLIKADPVHESDENMGWPVLKTDS